MLSVVIGLGDNCPYRTDSTALWLGHLVVSVEDPWHLLEEGGSRLDEVDAGDISLVHVTLPQVKMKPQKCLQHQREEESGLRGTTLKQTRSSLHK